MKREDRRGFHPIRHEGLRGKCTDEAAGWAAVLNQRGGERGYCEEREQAKRVGSVSHDHREIPEQSWSHD